MSGLFESTLNLAGIRHFAFLDSTGAGGGGEAKRLGVSKVSVVEISEKDQQLAHDEYSRLLVRLSKFDPVMTGQMSSFPEIGNFFF